jgi:hypothetical protein
MRVLPALVFCAAVTAATAAPPPTYISPRPSPPEYGHGLNTEEARDGWVSLFDGSTSFGWTGASVRDGILTGGATSTPFGRCDLRADVVAGGDIICGNQRVAARAGVVSVRIDATSPSPLSLGPGAAVRSLCVRPDVAPLPWTDRSKLIPHPTLPGDRQAAWSAAAGSALRAVGGPGCVELPGRYGDFVLQLQVTCRKPLTNAGVFVRSVPGDFLNGYEVQVFNGCEEGDAARPARYATGAIDDRRNARRLVSRDDEPFTMTIVATGPHLATWVNGVQVTDWTDERPEHENARAGLRLEPGAIQLQAHDRGTEVEFSNIRIAPFDARVPPPGIAR